jgi:hypothetical protein
MRNILVKTAMFVGLVSFCGSPIFAVGGSAMTSQETKAALNRLKVLDQKVSWYSECLSIYGTRQDVPDKGAAVGGLLGGGAGLLLSSLVGMPKEGAGFFEFAGRFAAKGVIFLAPALAGVATGDSGTRYYIDGRRSQLVKQGREVAKELQTVVLMGDLEAQEIIRNHPDAHLLERWEIK